MGTWLTKQYKIISYNSWGGGVKLSDVVSGSAYMHMFSSAQSVYVFWLLI